MGVEGLYKQRGGKENERVPRETAFCSYHLPCRVSCRPMCSQMWFPARRKTSKGMWPSPKIKIEIQEKWFKRIRSRKHDVVGFSWTPVLKKKQNVIIIFISSGDPIYDAPWLCFGSRPEKLGSTGSERQQIISKSYVTKTVSAFRRCC